MEELKKIEAPRRELLKEGNVLTEEEVRQLAHLPLLTMFYLSLQRRISSTPVTALELAAYAGVGVKAVEGVLEYLQKKGFIHAFKEGLPAYSLSLELDQVSVKDLLELLGEFRDRIEQAGPESSPVDREESHQKYRKIYSDLASEILQLFGEESANRLPL